MRINDHDPSNSTRVESLFLISKEGEIRKTGKLQQAIHDIYFSPQTPLGLHVAIHDANKDHPTGIIHTSIPHGKGVFRLYPPGKELGNTIAEREIPPFNQIRGIIPVYESPGYMNKDVIWGQSPGYRKGIIGKDDILVDLESFKGKGFGTQILLMEPNNTQAVLDYSSKIITNVKMDLAHIISIDIMKSFIPWLAIINYRNGF